MNAGARAASIDRSAARGLVVLALAFSAWSPSPTSAQERPRLQPGQRLRVSVDCQGAGIDAAPDGPGCPLGGAATGSLVAVQGDTLVMESGGSTARYPLAAVTLLEASRGSRSHWGTGALVGFVAGTTLTFLVLNSGSPASTNSCDPDNNQDAIGGVGTCLVLAAAVGGLPGGLVGAVVGSFFRTEEWERVPLGGVGLTLFPLGGRPTLAVSVPLR